MLDTNPLSPTRGSLSRTHWAWKFDDFPYPRLQEGLYALCRLHDLEGDDNPFYQSAALRKWIPWAFDYWVSRQHRHGCFDEAYPNEQSFAATAFTGFYCASAYLLWKDRLDAPVRERVEKALEKAGDWLATNDETHGVLSNHLAAAVAALQIMAEVCNQPSFSARARYFLHRIFDHQSDEGWMEEYGGADVGYGTHAFFYLADYWRRTKCDETLQALHRFAGFLSHFIHPDGTVGGEYASRDTEFFFPAGFEIMAPVCPTSAGIAQEMHEAIAERRVCGVWAMDVFNIFPMFNNLFFAMDAFQDDRKAEPVAWRRERFTQHFQEAGILVVNEPAYYAIIGFSKGGAVSLFDKDKRTQACRHSGLIATRDNDIFTSQSHVSPPVCDVLTEGRKFRLAVPWKHVDVPVPSPALFLLFRLFTLTVSRFAAASRWLKRRMVRVLITKTRNPGVVHSRHLEVTEDGISIEDTIEFPWRPTTVMACGHFSTIHMGSARYTDARTLKGGQDWELPPARKLRIHGLLTLDGERWSLVEQEVSPSGNRGGPS